ncbi:hypothetical protein Ancab_038670 [Ancistrocladus abbreviatus]
MDSLELFAGPKVTGHCNITTYDMLIRAFYKNRSVHNPIKGHREGEKGVKPFKMEIKLDYVLVPCGLLLLTIYHGWLVFRIIYTPTRTVIGLNAECRHQWVFSLMKLCRVFMWWRIPVELL